eukprot:GEZU01029133.1.p1 GENE.GEZU01029133.1~~GEZU01029133.1.p1  ORF type:complete len:232 (-),score=111.12 GEZU01029133.1:302-946(-)
MSKLSGDQVREAVATIIKDAEGSKFTQSIDLQFKLKMYDPTKDKRFSGSVKLPYMARPNMSVCILGDAYHCEQAEKLGLPFMSIEDLKKLNKNKKLVKKLAQKYEAFLASEALIKQIPRILGPGLNKAGKFPGLITRSDNIMEKVKELKCTVKFQLKKEINLGTTIGNVSQPAEHIIANLNMTVNFFVSLLKKHWQNVGSITVKSTQGRPFRLY